MTDQLDTAAIRAKAKMWHLPPGIADSILALCDALDAAVIVDECLRSEVDFAIADMTAIRAENERLRAELAWYGEQSRLARIIHSEGDAGRHALQVDGGNRARAALAQKEAE